MVYFILFFCSLFSPLFGMEQTNQSWDVSPETPHFPSFASDGIVEGVNVISGIYTERETDLITHGIDPFILERYYSRDNKRWGIYQDLDKPNLLGWYVNYDTILWHEIYTYSDLVEGNIALGTLSGNMLHFFRTKGSSQFTLKSFEGYMNLSEGLLSGQNHLRNQTLEKSSNNTFYQKLGDGTRRCYQGKKRFCRDSILYAATLAWERKPSGNWLFHHNGEFFTVSADYSTVLNWAKIKSEDGGFHWTITTSDNRTFTCYPGRDLHRVSGEHTNLLQQIVMPDGNSIHYRYDDKNFNATDCLLRKDLPEGRFLQIEYNTISLKRKVSALLAPLGNAPTPQKKYVFYYGDFYTDVYDALGNLTRYEYDQNSRITQTIRYLDLKPYRYEKNIWDETGSLLAKLVYDATGTLQFARRFIYDSRSNVTQETFFGPLTGTSFGPILLNAQGIPYEGGAEHYTKNYIYSEDGFNLLLQESDERGRTEYSYYPDTNLLKSKLIADERGIRIRQFRTYDGCGALTEYLEDDGNCPDRQNLAGCTFRKIIRFTNRATFPGVGQPEKKEELYYDFETQKERVLKQSLYSYNCHNECTQEDVLDGSGALLYSLEKEFDARGNCTYETDPLGNVIERQFDANGNLLLQRGPRPDVVVENGYDYCNRLIWTKKSDGFGNSRMIRFTYDLCGHKIYEMDDSGNHNCFFYDSLGRERAIQYPATLDSEERSTPSFVSKGYDLFDNISLWKDERGQVTTSSFTIRGKPYQILSSQGEERFEYDLRGNLTRKIAPDGSYICYTYDFLDRLTQTTWHSPQGEVLAETKATYNAFFLLSATDAAGVITTLEYDFAGREKKRTQGYACTEKEYSALGFLETLKQWYGKGSEEYLLTRFTSDFLGRKLTERVEDAAGNLYLKKEFQYDPDGNCIASSEYLTETSTATTFFTYDGFGREIERQDPCRNLYLTHYLENVADGLGGRGAYQIEIDPKGDQKELFFDGRGRVIKELISDGAQNKKCHKEYRYDGCGNQTLIKQELSPGVWQEVRFAYGENGKPIEITDPDGCGKTYLDYDQKGQLIRKETPLSVHHFDYNYLGKVIAHRAKSAEGEEEILYTYDKGGRATQIVHNGQMTERLYDPLGNILYEKQESGLEVIYTYDRMGRRTAMGLPANTSITYHYLGPFLRTVEKREKTTLTCSAVYLKRDLSGHIQETSLGVYGKIYTDYSLQGKKQSIFSHLWQQKGEYDPCGSLSLLTTQDIQGTSATTFGYDSLKQLTSENQKTYCYDGMGNRANQEVGPCNQLVKTVDKEFSYDSQGRMVAAGRDRCAYDALDRMVQYENTTYAYDGLNRRLAKNGELFLYDGNREIGKFNKKGELVEFRLLGEGEGADLGAVLFIELKGKRFIAIADLLGSVACLIDSSGKVAAHYRYTAFGEIQSPSTSLQNPWKFCSKRHDAESGWYFFGRRYYMAAEGRFTTPDPLGYSEGLNLYLFAHNHPHAGDLYGYQDKRGPLDSKNPLDFAIKCFTFAMRFVEWIGQNLIPLPGIRDLVEGIGRWGSGGNLFQLADYHKSRCHITVVGENKIPGITKVWINGAGNKLDEAIAAAKESSEDNQNAQITVLYNSSAGLLMDLVECFLLKWGGLSHPEKLIIRFVRETLRSSPNEIIEIEAHSQGGLHLHNASRYLTLQEQMQIKGVTNGSAKMIPHGVFAEIINNYSMIDPVILFSPIDFFKALITGNPPINFLTPSSFNPFKEHMISEKTYRQQRSRLNLDIQFKLSRS